MAKIVEELKKEEMEKIMKKVDELHRELTDEELDEIVGGTTSPYVKGKVRHETTKRLFG